VPEAVGEDSRGARLGLHAAVGRPARGTGTLRPPLLASPNQATRVDERYRRGSPASLGDDPAEHRRAEPALHHLGVTDLGLELGLEPDNATSGCLVGER